MTDTHHLLSWNPTIGHNAYQCRHKDTRDALHGIKCTNVCTLIGISQITTHRSQVSSPHGKLQEVHNDQSYFQIHRFVYYLCLQR